MSETAGAPRTWLFLACFSLAAVATAWPSAAAAQLELGSTTRSASHRFTIVPERSDRSRWHVEAKSPGPVSARAEWTGEARLELTLTRSGEERAVAGRSGEGPLQVRYLVTREALHHGTDWVVELVSLDGQKARGVVEISWPRTQADGLAGGSAGGSAGGTYFGWRQDDTPAQLPPPPPPPAEAPCAGRSDGPLDDFLGHHAERLLRQLRHLLGGDEQVLSAYLASEEASTTTVVERIELRSHQVDRLLGLDP